MTIYAIEQNDKIKEILKLLGSGYFPGLSNSIKIATNYVQSEWVKGVKKSKSKEGWKNQYIRSIHINFQNELNSEVYADENNKYVNFVEKGIKRFDMKLGLINGPHSRQGKNGERYNIIFLRKGVPGTQSIPNIKSVTYEKIKKLNKQNIIQRYRTVAIGQKTELKSKQVKKRIHTPTSKGPEGIQKLGSTRHTHYGNFRIVTKNSTGWIYPGIPAAKVFSVVKNTVKPKVKSILQSGLKLDLDAGNQYKKENK